MLLRISQEDDPETGRTTLRLEGSFRLAEAEMFETICHDLRQQQERSLLIDLAGVTFLDDDSARVLRRLKAQRGITLTGLQLFTERMIDSRLSDDQA